MKSSIQGMDSHYAERALAQRRAMEAGLGEAELSLMRPLAKRSQETWALADLGCADGVHSFPVLSAFLSAFEVPPDRVGVFHVDLPTSDFPALLRNLYEHPESYVKASGGRANPILVPGSFYQPLLLPESIDFLFSTTALHYASRSAGPLTGHIDPLYAQVPEEQRAWAEQSRQDRDLAMLCISRAVKPGGKLWLVVPASQRGEDQALSNHWYRAVKAELFEELQRLAQEGAVDHDLLNSFVLPIHDRDPQEWRTWFEDHARLWNLDFFTVRELPNPYYQSFLEHGDHQRFASEYLGSIEAWSRRIIENLVPDPEVRSALTHHLQQRFAQEPDNFAVDNVSLYLGATKL